MKIIRYTDSHYQEEVRQLINRSNLDLATQDSTVREIIDAVKSEKDEALLRYTNQFDRCDYQLDDIKVSEKNIQEAYKQVAPGQVEALKTAAENIRRYHEKQVQESWQYQEGGVTLGQMVRPITDCRHLCSRWQSILSVFGSYERHSCKSGWSRENCHVQSFTGW